jgi:aminoglycoside phosphotransferase (APT) family kinase protein
MLREWLAPLGAPAPEDILAAALELPPPAGGGLAHGDLHLRHLLVDEAGAPTAVIDWIDVCRGDPAIDLPLYWGYLPPEGRTAFHEVYGALDRPALLRSRVLAVFLWATMVEYGHQVGPEWLFREALLGVDRAVADLR